MYRTCLHCHASLGDNTLIEHFAIGRRLAFDADKGRLWVVCTKCRRWNLTPIEERWEAIEECEKSFRATSQRASTDNISVATTKEGLELVRIGNPLIPEMAAWRYGRELQRRWLTRGVPFTAGLMGFFTLDGLVQGQVLPMTVGLGIMVAAALPVGFLVRRRARVRLALPSGRVKTIHAFAVVAGRESYKNQTSRLVPLEDGRWGIEYGSEAGVVSGTSGTHFLRGVLTAMNFLGARRKRVNEATSLISAAGGSQAYVEKLVKASIRVGAPVLNELPPDMRFALEMALHEDSERIALQGDLRELNEEWALAESIAQIADNMFLPEGVAERHNQLLAGAR